MAIALAWTKADNAVWRGVIAVGRYVRVDRPYNQPFRPTGYAMRVVLKWTGLIFLWIVVNTILLAARVSYLEGVTTAALIGYAVYCIRRYLAPRPRTVSAPPPPGPWPPGMPPPQSSALDWR